MIADVPVNEFWTGSGYIGKNPHTERASVEFNKRIVAAEAFTGSPAASKYTEDPAWLKHTADGGYAAGNNMYFLHHWVHQPFDDRYQPGLGMGWWGTHFSRHQTWFHPGKAFFTYLARCQMLLQQGTPVPTKDYSSHRSTPFAEIFFVVNPNKFVRKLYSFPVSNRIPELWDPYTGTISSTSKYIQHGDTVDIELNLEPDQSMIVVFPYNKEHKYTLKSEIITVNETTTTITGAWNVYFEPKLDKPFSRKFPELTDLSKQKENSLKYFAGTARYDKTINLTASQIKDSKQIILNLGELEDIAELEVNGKKVGVLWAKPYKADITHFLKTGSNTLSVYVSVNWANRLIGDEQEEADFEWGSDQGVQGRAMKAFPEWFIKKEQRPSKNRKTFNVWYYHRKDSPLYPAGLMGPVKLELKY